jgi:hypothetical protein
VSSRINDKTSSIVVPSGCIVDIYEHTSYRGRKATLKAGTYRYSQFRRLFPNDRLSSLKVRDAKTATAAPPTAPACEYKCLPGDRKWEWDSAYRNCRTCRRYATKAACETALAESGHCGATSTVSETFSNLRVSAARNRPATFTLKTDILASSVVIQHLGGQVSCSGSGGYSNFGCGNNLIALLLTQSKRRVLPSTNVKGYKKTSHRHAHWYTLSGVSRRSKTMKWQLNKAQMLKAGTYQLWYNEDLTGGTESDNRGTAVYKVTITGSRTQPKTSCTGSVRLYEHDLSGRTSSYRKGSFTRVSSSINDRTSSVVVPSGCKVEVFEHYNYRGRKATLKAGTYRYSQFKRLFPNDRLSSLKVSDDAPTPPKPSPCVGCEKEVATLKTHLKTSQTANTQLKTKSAQKDKSMKSQADQFAKKAALLKASFLRKKVNMMKSQADQLKEKDEMMKTQADKFAKKEVNIQADYKQKMQDMRAKAGLEVATLKTHLKTSQTANTQLKTESAQKDEMMKTQADKFAKKEVNIHADYKQEMQDMRAKAGFTIASIDKERSELKQQLEPQRRLVRRL